MVNGQDDQSDTSANSIVANATKAAELSLLYRGSTRDECTAWQEKFRRTLRQLMGDSTPPAKWTVRETRRKQFDDYLQLKCVLHADDVPPLPLYLLIPDAASSASPAPGVLCIHGHSPYGNDSVVGCEVDTDAREFNEQRNYDYGRQFVRRGYIVVAPCMVPFGQRVDRDLYKKTDPCGATFLRMQAVGKLLMTENLRDLRWAISFLQSRSETQKDRIGSAGLSYGGRMSMMVSAVDERIKVAAISGAWHLLRERVQNKSYTCGGQIIPGILQYGDYPEIASLIAPRPSVWEVGKNDRGVHHEAGRAVTARVQRAYNSLDAADQLYFDHHDGGHQWSGQVSFPVFDAVLKR